MMWLEVRTHWRPLRAQMRTRWEKLSDSDLELIAGRRQALVGALMRHYGVDQIEAAEEADAFVRSLQVLSL